MCGLVRTLSGGTDCYIHPGERPTVEPVDNWRPESDVAQAIRCFEAAKLGTQISREQKGGPWRVTVYANLATGDLVVGKDVSLPAAIVKAIAAAKGWT